MHFCFVKIVIKRLKYFSFTTDTDLTYSPVGTNGNFCHQLQQLGRALSVAENFTLKYQLILTEMSLSVDPPPTASRSF